MLSSCLVLDGLKFLKSNIKYPVIRTPYAFVIILPNIAVIKQGKIFNYVKLENLYLEFEDFNHKSDLKPTDSISSKQEWKFVKENGEKDVKKKKNFLLPVLNLSILNVLVKQNLIVRIITSKKYVINKSKTK